MHVMFVRFKRVLLAPVVCLLVFPGCGLFSSASKDKPWFNLSVFEGVGGKASYGGVPAEVAAGIVRIDLLNSGLGPHDAQFVRVDGDQSVEDAAKALRSASKGKPLPDWLHPAGGIGRTPADRLSTVDQPLERGTHHIIDTAPRGARATFRVTGGEGGKSLPRAPGKITASDYRFKSSGLIPGPNRILFKNEGKEPHHIVLAPLKTNKTIAQAREFLETEQGASPINLEKSVATAVVDGGSLQVVDLRLEEGEYAAICYIRDRKGGPPHTAKGMVQEVKVRPPPD